MEHVIIYEDTFKDHIYTYIYIYIHIHYIHVYTVRVCIFTHTYLMCLSEESLKYLFGSFWLSLLENIFQIFSSINFLLHTCSSSPPSPLHFSLSLSLSSSLFWSPLLVFFTSSSSSSSPPAGPCEQSLFSFLSSSFSFSWNSLLIYVHINYLSFVISTVGHDTMSARAHAPRPHFVNLNEKKDSSKRIMNPLHDKF